MGVTKLSLESPRSELCVRGLFGCVPRDLHTHTPFHRCCWKFCQNFLQQKWVCLVGAAHCWHPNTQKTNGTDLELSNDAKLICVWGPPEKLRRSTWWPNLSFPCFSLEGTMTKNRSHPESCTKWDLWKQMQVHHLEKQCKLNENEFHIQKPLKHQNETNADLKMRPKFPQKTPTQKLLERAGPQWSVFPTNFLNNNPPTAWTFLKMDEILVFKAPKGKWNGRTIAHFSTISTSRNHPFFWVSTDYSRSLLLCLRYKILFDLRCKPAWWSTKRR